MIDLDFFAMQGTRVLHRVAAFELLSELCTLSEGQKAAGIHLAAFDSDDREFVVNPDGSTTLVASCTEAAH